MRRILALALAIGVVLLAPLPPVARAATLNTGAVTFTVDHKAKTITVNIKLTVYPGCSGDPQGDKEDRPKACTGGGGQVTQFLLDKIKDDIEKIWNNGNYYRCYRLIVVVDVERGTDRKQVPKGRVGVRIDPSPAGVRSFVDSSGTVGNGEWRSSDPRDRTEPTNDGAWETTWSEDAQSGDTYAHEAGHVMGLDDTYEDIKDAKGKTIGSRPKPGAPLDVMSGSDWSVAPETMSLLIERNRDRLVDKAGKKVDIKDLRCDFTLEVDLLMIGTNPAFKGKVTAHGKIDMHVVGGQMPLGNDWIPYEGTGTLTYAVEPIGAAPCTFTYKGRGRFLAGASMSVKFPMKASELKVTVAPKLDGIPKDKLVARGCPGGSVTVKPVSLLTLFYADRLGRDWVIDDWDPATTYRHNDKFIGHYGGHCARSLCDERDTFVLAEAPNGP